MSTESRIPANAEVVRIAETGETWTRCHSGRYAGRWFTIPGPGTFFRDDALERLGTVIVVSTERYIPPGRGTR